MGQKPTPRKEAVLMSRRIALTCLAATLLLGTGRAAAQSGSSYGAFEPNNSASEAYGPLSGGTTYHATIENADDQDWYVFYVAGEQQMDVSIASTTTVNGCTVHAKVLDRAGNYQDQGYTVNPNQTADIRWTSPSGTTAYYLVVTDSSYDCSYGTANTYSFQVNPPGAVTTTPGSAPPASPSPGSAPSSPNPIDARPTVVGLAPAVLPLRKRFWLVQIHCPHACTFRAAFTPRIAGRALDHWHGQESGSGTFRFLITLTPREFSAMRRALAHHQRVTVSGSFFVTDNDTGATGAGHVTRRLH
jgi:hypothetical protein